MQAVSGGGEEARVPGGKPARQRTARGSRNAGWDCNSKGPWGLLFHLLVLQLFELNNSVLTPGQTVPYTVSEINLLNRDPDQKCPLPPTHSWTCSCRVQWMEVRRETGGEGRGRGESGGEEDRGRTRGAWNQGCLSRASSQPASQGSSKCLAQC